MIVPDIKAVENPNDKYVVQSIPMDQILSDPGFNCRGQIAPIDVLDLAKDIADRGLDQPIVLQKYEDKANPKIKFRIVAGHRRHMAFKINSTENIPAYVREDLDELQARMLNLRENLHRKDLNVKQEAHALKFFLNHKSPKGVHLFTEAELADIFGQSRGWIQIRKIILELPEDIQDEAASGMLNQEQIRLVGRQKKKDDMYALVRKIKERKIRGEKVRLAPSVQRSSDVMKSKQRGLPEIAEMSDLIYETIGPSLTTRFAAWCRGIISTVALYSSLEEHCKEQGIEFQMPKFINNALLGIKTDNSQPMAITGDKS